MMQSSSLSTSPHSLTGIPCDSIASVEALASYEVPQRIDFAGHDDVTRNFTREERLAARNYQAIQENAEKMRT